MQLRHPRAAQLPAKSPPLFAPGAVVVDLEHLVVLAISKLHSCCHSAETARCLSKKEMRVWRITDCRNSGTGATARTDFSAPLFAAAGNPNAEFLHARLQRRAFHPKQFRSALRPGDNPVGLLQR